MTTTTPPSTSSSLLTTSNTTRTSHDPNVMIWEAHATVKRYHQASYQELQSEIQHLRQIQQSVQSQVTMLQDYVQHKQQQKQDNRDVDNESSSFSRIRRRPS
jgi:protein associated with RNAse G/E